MSNEVTTQGESNSTDFGFGENEVVETNPTGTLDDAFNDAFAGILDDVEEQSSSELEDETKEPVVSGADENATPDVDSDDESEVDLEDEETEESNERPIVSYDEAKEFSFELDGEVYSVNDFKSWKGQLAKQQESLKEVEEGRKEIAEEREKLTQAQEMVRSQQTVNATQTQMAQLGSYHQQLTQQLNEAVNNNDGNEAALIQGKLAQVSQKYKELETEYTANQSELAAKAATELERYGFGSLNTDTQRQEAFKEYAFSNIPKGLISVVNTNPELLAIVEKARLYDKSNAAPQKAKLKGGSGKTLKGGAAKTAKKAKSDPLADAFFNATSGIDFRN